MALMMKHLIGSATMLAVAVATRTVQAPTPMQAVDRTRLDTTCAPCQDFYRFANGAWLDTVSIPPGQAEWGPLPDLRRRNQAFIADVLDSLGFAMERHARTAMERKIGMFYRTCVDSSGSRADALGAIQPELEHIKSIRTSSDLGRAIGRMQRYRVRALFLVSTGYDATERVGIQAYAFFNAFSLPLASYLGTDSTSARTRASFATRAAQVFEQIGDPPDSARVNARRVIEFETAMRRIRMADSGFVWLPMAIVRDEGPAFGWDGFVSELGRPDLPSMGVRPRTMLRAIDSLATSRPLDEWKAYLRWRLTSALAPVLEARPGAAAGGAQVRQQCAAQTTQLLSEGVARAYVDRVFPPQAKAAALTLVEDMRELLRERILTQNWLGAASKRKAITKLDSIRLWMGYPARMDDFSSLEVRNGSFAQNQLATREYATNREMARVGTRLDRDRWIQPNVAIADGTYYMQNALAITAAQLQPPFFDPRAEPAANYGKIGQVIGHELTHAFGPEGRRYNELGQREDWWTQDEVREFGRLADLIVRQYDQFIIIDSIRQNGRSTVSENIADIGGVTLAWQAFNRAMQRQPRSVIGGFTPEQRFFIAYAQGINTSVEVASRYATQALADQYSHSVAKWRVNGPLSHLSGFAAAFGCKQGDPMVRADTLRWTVW